ncbi:hypothetical protein [Streptomyces sp. TE5632]
MPSGEAAQLIAKAIAAAVAGDTETATDLVARLGTDSDAARMYSVCCTAATASKQALHLLFDGKTPALDRGEYWTHHDLRPVLDRARNQTLGDNPARQFASRFLVAYCNDDQETDVALFGAAARIGGEHFVRCVTQLFADTAGLARAAMQKTEAEGG